MTDEEQNAEIGCLIQRYNASVRRVACLKSKLQKSSRLMQDVSVLLRCGAGFSAGELHDEVGKLDWNDLVECVQNLVEETENRGQIEDLMREMGLSQLIKA